ncbi:MAG: UvrD-helicase domain-containing protein [Candidatus Omnitrophota bacterium]|nr:UvrD-helicase domain-containing protein [Candidatus Omnitrophota bacterium]
MTPKIKASVKTKDCLRFPGVDVVEASAGSGKTYALAMRYVRLILNPALKTEDMPLKTILAATFTNKAAIEMKQRILELLKKIALDAFRDEREKEDIVSSLTVDYPAAAKMARNTMDDIIDHYNFFQVQTIDSFINMLLKGCAFHLGFASNFRVKENYRLYLAYGLDRLIDKARGNKKILGVFEEFLNYYLFVENKDGWFSKRDILGLMKALYGRGNTYGGIFRMPGVKAEELIGKKKAIIELIGKIRNNAPEEAHKGFIKALNAFLEKNKDGFNVENISNYFARNKFPISGNADTPRKTIKLWDDARKSMKELCLLESFAIFRPYVEIFNLTLDEFRKLAAFDDVVFLGELNRHARRLAGGKEVSVSEIYYRIAARFRHYLIDEFQDTSRLQWNNMLPMLEDALSSGGSLFYVGDKKQAVFRFRGGDVSLFDSIQEDFKNYAPKQAVLSKNWRSQKEIVEFNNETFSGNNLRKFVGAAAESQGKTVRFTAEDIEKILSIFKGSRQERKEENKYGYVRVEAFDAPAIDDRNSAARQKLLRLIKELQKRFSAGDIAILARENADIKLFTSWLIEEGIPVESEKTLNIRENALIKEVISFLRFLNSPIDDLSFASFILGRIFQAASGLSYEDVRDFLFKLRVKRGKDKGIYLYREFRNRFGGVWDGLLDEFFRSVGFAPLYEFVISIFSKFKIVGNFPKNQAFFMRLLELINEKEEDYPGVSSFLKFFEEAEEKDLFVNVSHADAVKIMTIHKAKGLEFPAVIIPFLEINVNIGTGITGSKKPFVVRQSEDGSLRLIQLKKKYGLFSEELGRKYKDEYIKSLTDELNALYVALTRAKHELYIFIPSKSSNKNNLARALIHCDGVRERGSKREYKKAAQPCLPAGREKRTVITLPVSRYSDWLSVLKDEFITHPEPAGRDKLMMGSAIHFILSCIGNLQSRDKEVLLTAAAEKAKYAYPYEKNLDEYVKIARAVIENRKFRQFFYVKDGEVFREKEVAASSGARKVLDRLVITPKEAWVVDYKSSKDEMPGYVKQVAGYVDIVRTLYPKRKVKGFLIYLDNFVMEEVYGKSGSV